MAVRSDQLNNQILDYVDQGGLFERQEAESFAIDEVRSILSSNFYLDFEFRPTLPFSFTRKYYAGDRIIIDFEDWVAATGSGDLLTDGYKKGNCVIKDGIGYSAKEDNVDTSWNINNWIAIGKQYDIYFVNYPYDIFQLNPGQQIGIKTPGLYSVGDKTCWLKNIYLCRNNSIIIGHQAREQYYSVNDIPSPNLFPNFKETNYTDGNRQWIDKGEYFFKEILPFYPSEVDEDENEVIDAWTNQYRKNWTLGDNRSNTMKQIVIAIAIAKLMGRNSFQLKERSIQRDWAYRKLEKIFKGENTTLIPILQPDQGGNLSWGGMPKIINTF